MRPWSILCTLALLGCGDDARRRDAPDGTTFDATESIDTTRSDDVPDATAAVPDSDASDGDAGSDTSPPGPAALPPWLAYCDDACVASQAEVVVIACPEADSTCEPTRSTRIVPSVDGRVVSAVAFPVSAAEGLSLRIAEGPGSVAGAVVTAFSSRIVLRSDLAVEVSYYELSPDWGGATLLDFATATRTSEVLDSVFFAHPSYDTGTAAEEFHVRGQATISAERAVTGVVSEKIHAFVMPTELAAVSGEGNFSYGDGTVASNYGNPPYIEALGGILPVAFPRFAHEVAHEHFDEIRSHFTGNTTCLNEGLADALAYLVGDLPKSDFGPIGVRGIDFDAGCRVVDEVHDVGNCYFWQVDKAGLLDADFIHGIFHPQRTFDFDSCDQAASRTGDALLVYFTEARGGADMRAVIDAIGLRRSATYAEALVALGFGDER